MQVQVQLSKEQWPLSHQLQADANATALAAGDALVPRRLVTNDGVGAVPQVLQSQHCGAVSTPPTWSVQHECAAQL